MEGLPMERTALAAGVVGGTVLAVGSLLALGLHVPPGQDTAALRSAAETTRGPSSTGSAVPPGWTPEPEDFRGATATAGDWRLSVTEVHVDEDGVITGDSGDSAHAPEGTAYHVFTLRAVNGGSEPLRFAPAGSTAASVDGRTFVSDPEAERASTGPPGPPLAPGTAAETQVIFPVPADAHLYEIVVTVEYGAVFANLEARR